MPYQFILAFSDERSGANSPRPKWQPYLARRRGDPGAVLPHLEAAYARPGATPPRHPDATLRPPPRDAAMTGALARARLQLGDQAGARAVIRSRVVTR